MNKKILSWDVGIKNLAYCLMERKNDDSFGILQWGIINLADDRQECDYEMNNNKKCDKIAKFVVHNKEDSTKVKNCCNTHKKKLVPTLIKIVYKKTKKEVKKHLCDECEEHAIYELTNMNKYWCEKHSEKHSKKVLKDISVKKIQQTNCNKQPIQELAEKLFSRLDSKDFSKFLEAEEVLIENQPSLMNPTMKTISSLLYSYFAIRGVVEKEKTNSKIELIKFVSPSNKLKVNEKNTNKLLDKSENKKEKVYGLTKKLGEKYCRALICENDCEIIDKVKKKDDMCDAFLQGFKYLFTPLPQKYFDKIEKIGFDKPKVKALKKIKVESVKKIDNEE